MSAGNTEFKTGVSVYQTSEYFDKDSDFYSAIL